MRREDCRDDLSMGSAGGLKRAKLKKAGDRTWRQGLRVNPSTTKQLKNFENEEDRIVNVEMVG